MAMNLWDYFQVNCSMLLTMEREVWLMHHVMMREVRHNKLKQTFEQYNDPIRHQISNLEQIVDRLGGIVGPEESAVAQGMMLAHQQFHNLNPSPELIDLHNAMEGDKAVHTLMSAHTSLIAVASQLGAGDMVEMLEENLHSEQALCTDLEGLYPELLARIDLGMQKAA